MKSYSAVVLALAAAANAVQFTNPGVRPEPGKPFELTWSGAEGPVTITLKSGSSDNLKTVEELATDVDGDSTTVTLDPKKLPSDTYAFEISDGSSEPNYSVQFSFKGEGKASESASASDSKTASSSSSASSASATKSSATTSASKTASSTASSRPSRTSSPEEEEDKDVPDSGAGHNMSPFAFIFVTAAAMLYFN